MPPCTDNTADASTCVADFGSKNWADAVDICHGYGGTLPRPLSSAEATFFGTLYGVYWVALTSEEPK